MVIYIFKSVKPKVTISPGALTMSSQTEIHQRNERVSFNIVVTCVGTRPAATGRPIAQNCRKNSGKLAYTILNKAKVQCKLASVSQATQFTLATRTKTTYPWGPGMETQFVHVKYCREKVLC